MIKLRFLFLLGIFSFQVQAQKSNTSPARHVFKSSEPVNVQDFFSKNAISLGIDEATQMVEIKRTKSRQSEHIKYQQYYKNIPVYGSVYILHSKDQLVHKSSGVISPNINISTTPSVTSDDICHFAIQKCNSPEQNSGQKTGHREKNEDLVASSQYLTIIDASFPKSSGVYELAYAVVVESKLKPFKKEIILSAINGRVIFEQNLIQHGNSPGVGHTFYYGDQNIITDSIAPNKFILRDMSRGQGITTYTQRSGNSLELFEDDDNHWEESEDWDLVGIDAHYCTEKFYDLMFEYFGYSGLDGNGLSMNPVVHVFGADNFVNAYWDGDKAYFGHGNCHSGPLTTLSVVGHEFTHGVTQYNSNLIYAGESGALNESFSDIFGKSLEYIYDKDNFSWELGPEFAISDFGPTFRSMSDPKSLFMPEMYKGVFWEDGADVHYNSSVLNYWYYLLIEGKSGTNENNEDYNVAPVSLKDALEIVFLTQTSYLTPSSNYPAMYQYSLAACEDLFGVDSPQYNSLNEAWKAVGLPNDDVQNNEYEYDLGISSQNSYQMTCLENEYFVFDIDVTNFGSKTIQSGEIATLEIEGYPSISVVFENGLKPNETKKITIDNTIFVTQSTFLFYNIAIQYPLDENTFNNYLDFYLDNIIPSTDYDLELAYVFPETECGSNSLNGVAYIRSNKCEPRYKGEKMSLLFKKNGVTIGTYDFTLESNILPFDFYSVPFALEPTANIVLNNISVTLKFDKDPYTANNAVFSETFQSPFLIKDKVNFNFTNQTFENYFDVNYFKEIEYAYYQGDDYLRVFDNYYNNIPCNSPDANFSSDEPDLSTCLDLTNMVNPKLSFDLIQFRTNSYDLIGDEEFSKRSAIMKIETDVMTEYIYGQVENEKVHHAYDLPQGYKGKLEISFFNSISNPYFGFIDQNYDYQFVDNLIIESSTGSIDIFTTTNISIQPNPSNNFISLQMEGNAKVQVINTQGQLVKEFVVSTPNSVVDISELQNGYYICKVVHESGQLSNLPFIKL